VQGTDTDGLQLRADDVQWLQRQRSAQGVSGGEEEERRLIKDPTMNHVRARACVQHAGARLKLVRGVRGGSEGRDTFERLRGCPVY
jgi:hypothetical protein